MDGPKKPVQCWVLEDSSSESGSNDEAADLQWVLKTTLQTELDTGSEQHKYQSALSRRVRNIRESGDTGKAVGGDGPDVASTNVKNGDGTEAKTGDDELLSTAKIKNQLSNNLNDMERTGMCAFHQKIDNSPNPGVFITGFEDITLPISPREVNLIKAASEQNSHGGASRVHVVAGALIEIKNTGWDKIVGGVLKRLAFRMGINVKSKGINAVNPCLILYEEGCDKAEQNPTGNSPVTFGYLDVLLSTPSDEDKVKLQHGRTIMSISTAGVSKFDSFFLAWFLDVAVTYPAVKLGSRLVLRYQLIHNQPCLIDTAAKLVRGGSELQLVLQSWKMQQASMAHKQLAYLLQHKYSDTNLTFANLKEQDRVVVAQLLDVGSPAGFHICLGNLERITRGVSDTSYNAVLNGHHRMSKLDYETYEITHVTGLYGVEPLSRSGISLVASHIMGGRTPFRLCDDEIFDASENFLQQTYRHSVVLILPEEQREPMFVKTSIAVVDLFLNRYQSLDYDPGNDKGAIWACNVIVGCTTWASLKTIYSDKVILKAIQLIGFLDDEELLKAAIPVGILMPEHFRALKSVAKRRGNDWLQKTIADQLSLMQPFSVRCQTIVRVSKVHLSETWANKQYSLAVNSLPLVSTEDGEHVKKLIGLWAESPLLRNTLYGAMVRDTTSFVVRMKFLSGVLTTKNVPTLALQFCLSEYSKNSFPKSIVTDALQEARSLGEIFINGSALYQSQFSSEFKLIISKLVADAEEAAVLRMKEFCLPLLESIAELPLNTIERHGSRLAPLFQSTLSSWIRKCTPEIPVPPQDRVRQKLGCGSCSDCGNIDEFLENPEKIKFVSSFARSPMDHLRPFLTKEIAKRSFLEIAITKQGAQFELMIRKIFPGFPAFGKQYDQAQADLKESIQQVFPSRKEKSELLGKHQRQICVLNLPVPASEIEFPE